MRSSSASRFSCSPSSCAAGRTTLRAWPRRGRRDCAAAAQTRDGREARPGATGALPWRREEWMTAEVLDQLLTTLAVRLHAFSVCEIQQGWRLRVGPSEAIIVHYVLAGSGAVRSGDGPWIPFSPRSVIVVPAHKPHDVGEAGTVVQEVRSEDHCTLLDDGLVKFTAGEGTADTLLVCGMISASYAGTWGLFAPLCDPLVEDLSANNVLQQTFELMFAEIAKPSVGTQAMAETLMKQCLILLLRQHLLHAEGASSIFMPLKDQRL